MTSHYGITCDTLHVPSNFHPAQRGKSHPKKYYAYQNNFYFGNMREMFMIRFSKNRDHSSPS